MYHPMIQYELVRHQIAEELRNAERERRIRRAGSPTASGALDAVRFRDRITRLFGAIWPSTQDTVDPAAA
jgi:hypothetical protein